MSPDEADRVSDVCASTLRFRIRFIPTYSFLTASPASSQMKPRASSEARVRKGTFEFLMLLKRCWMTSVHLPSGRSTDAMAETS